MRQKDIVIFDLDGTLALNEHRQHFLKQKSPDWKSFTAACIDDLPNTPIIDLCNLFNCCGYKNYILSGRSADVQKQTIKWLKEHSVFYQKLYMREVDDFRDDRIVKKEMLDKYIDKSKVAWIFDDRNKVVSMWREEGLSCLQVAEGDF